MRTQYKKPRILLGLLVTLALILSVFGTVLPVYAADVALTKGVTPTTPNIYRLGDTIHYTMSIRNISDALGTYENVVVESVSDVLPDSSTVYPTGPDLPYTLTPGQFQSYTYDWVATVAGAVNNTFYASGYQISTGGRHDAFNLNVQKSSLVIDPDIQIVKYVNGDDANVPTGPAILVGAPANFTYEVTNTGLALPNNSPADDLYPVVVVDDNGTPGAPGDDFSPAYTGGDDGDGRLNPLETWYYSYTGTAAAGQHTNIATATGTPAVGSNVTDDDPANYFGSGPCIHIEKSTNGEDADLPTGPVIPVGGAVLWEYVVTNCGNVALSNIIVTDSEAGVTPGYVSGDDGDNILQTTETWVYQAGGTAVAGQYANTGNVTGTPPVGAPVSDDDPSHYFGSEACTGSIEILKQDDAGAPLAGACFNVTPNPYGSGTLTVCDDLGNDADTTTTGRIQLINVPPGSYNISEVQAPAGGYVLDPDVEPVTVTCDTTASATFTNSKEGCTGCLKICKYEDKNGNGRKDCGEPYLSGWTFNVTGPGYSQLVTTGGDKCRWSCDDCVTLWDIPAGWYTITEVTPLPDGWTNTDPGDGTYTKKIEVLCDGGDLLFGCGDCSPKCPTVVEFGNQPPGCLKICKYEDKDGDGYKDYGEPYLSDWTFNVSGPEGSQLVTTGGSGGTCGSCDYCVTICNLIPSDYTVTEVTPLPEGWTNTDPGGAPPYTKTVTVESDETSTVKFGNQGPCSGCLKIYKYNDKDGDGQKDWWERYLAGWTFSVTDAAGNIVGSGTTNRYGYVTICGLARGQYTVTETPQAGWTNTDPKGGSLTKMVEVYCGRTTTVKFGNKQQLV